MSRHHADVLLGAGLLALVLLGGAIRAQEKPRQPSPPVLVQAGRFVDPVAGDVRRNVDILVEGDRVKAVAEGLSVPAGAQVIDLRRSTVLPGLVDCHTHITSQPGENYYSDLFRQSPIDIAVKAHVYARRTVEAGFTTVRDVGAVELVDVALRNAIERGELIGPRMYVATLAVGATGGHGDLTGFSPDLLLEKERQIGRQQRESFQKAVGAGVKIAYGTDAGVYPHGWNARQFAYMVKFGLTPMQSIQAATINAADLIGISDRIGSIAPGKFADIVAVDGDPLSDVSLLEHPSFVMKGGAVVVRAARPADASSH